VGITTEILASLLIITYSIHKILRNRNEGSRTIDFFLNIIDQVASQRFIQSQSLLSHNITSVRLFFKCGCL